MKHSQRSVSRTKETSSSLRDVGDLESALKGDFRLKRHLAKGRLPVFQHLASEVDFVLIRGGPFDFGLSAKEEIAARRIQNPAPLNIPEMRPVTAVKMESFLISSTPMLLSSARMAVDTPDLVPFCHVP